MHHLSIITNKKMYFIKLLEICLIHTYIHMYMYIYVMAYDAMSFFLENIDE